MLRVKSVAKVARRTYASVASAPVVSTSNGIKVAAIEGDAESQLASLSLVINGGSRFETPDNAGAAHYLKAFGFRNTQGRTSFRTVREAELNGATLTAQATRENITYTVQCFKDAVPYFVDVLADIASATKYTEHEFRDISKAVEFESLCARTNPVSRLVDGIHQAAFRNGLGNSLYALPSSPVDTGDAVRQYAQAAFASNRVAIVGTGVGAQQLADLVSQSSLSTLEAQPLSLVTSASKFVGGTQQVYESASPVSHYALAFSAEPAMAPVLVSLLGAQRRMKWSTGVSPLAKLAASGGFEAEAFSFAYSDAAVVGVLVSAPTSQIKAAVEKVAAVIQKDIATAGDEAVQRAVAAAKLDAAETMATLKGTQLALGHIALGQSAATLESVEMAASKLSKAAPAVFKSKPVAASVGLSQTTAYVDTLGF